MGCLVDRYARDATRRTANGDVPKCFLRGRDKPPHSQPRLTTALLTYMTVTEYDAQCQATSDLRTLIETLGVFSNRELQISKLDQLWIYFTAFLKEQVVSERVDKRAILRILRAGAVKRLVRLLVDFQSLNRYCWRSLFTVRGLIDHGWDNADSTLGFDVVPCYGCAGLALSRHEKVFPSCN